MAQALPETANRAGFAAISAPTCWSAASCGTRGPHLDGRRALRGRPRESEADQSTSRRAKVGSLPGATVPEQFQREGKSPLLGLFRQAALQASNASRSLRVASSSTAPLFSASQ